MPSFHADAIKVLPGSSAKNNPPPVYALDLAYGTCVKLYNYRWSARNLLTLGGRYELEEYLYSPCLPFRVTETRDYRANYYSATVIGGWNSAIGGDEDDGGKLEEGFPGYADLDLPGIGGLPYQIAAFQDHVDRSTVPHGVYFVVNGQVHGSLPANFISSRLKFDYLKTGLLVAVDCTGMNARVREDFFMASRDRVRRNEVYNEIERQLTDALRNHPGLQELNQRRRQSEMERHLTERTPLDALQALIDSDPSLASLFSLGDQLATSTGPGPRPPFVGRRFPTFFRLSKEPAGGLVKLCPVNRTCRVEFETDAANDYFNRSDSPGHILIEPPNLIEQSHLWGGRLDTRFRVPWDAAPGDVIDVKVTVTDIERDARGQPLICTFKLKAATEVDDGSYPGPAVQPRRPNANANVRAVALALPNVVEVRRESWREHEPPFNEYEAIRLQHDGEGGYDCYLNIDNRFLVTELARAKEADKPQVKTWFRNGLLLAAVGMIKHQRRLAEISRAAAHRGGPRGGLAVEEGPAEDLELISQYCSGLGQVIVPIIRALSRAPLSTCW